MKIDKTNYREIRYLLVWEAANTRFCYGYETLEELNQVIETIKDKPYIHYKCYQVLLSQELLYSN